MILIIMWSNRMEYLCDINLSYNSFDNFQDIFITSHPKLLLVLDNTHGILPKDIIPSV